MSLTMQDTRPERTAAGIPMLDFVAPMPGFPAHRSFALVRLDEAGMLAEMRSLSDETLRFLVVPAAAFRPDYAPVVDDDVVTELGITVPSDVLLLLVVTAASTLADTTVNLMAPILVNLRTNRAMQVVLDDPAYDVRAPLV
jgi:flagellar assembly factor FliW